MEGQYFVTVQWEAHDLGGCVCVKTQNDPDVLVVISSLIRTSGTSGETSGWTQNTS